MIIQLLLIQTFGLVWWLYLLIIVVSVSGAVIYHKLKLKAAQNEKAEIERKMLEKSELLAYSKCSEQKAREEAAMANVSKSNLLSKITHEIRTPMNAMMGMASLLNDTCLNAEQRGFASSLLQSGDNLLSLINDILMQDILEFSKIDSGKELEQKDFEVRNCIEQVLDVFGSKAAETGLDIVYNIDDNVPLQLAGDAYRLRQVLMNLVENSFRFVTHGEIFIGVKMLEKMEGNKLNMAFEVRDTGAGMDEEKLQLVSADLLSSGEALIKKAHIGLTLVICKKLVSLMGGAIKVESRLNEGTSFKFNVLLQPALQPQRAGKDVEIPGFEGRKVLIADDNPAVLSMIKNQLAKWKLTSYTAASGTEAIRLLECVPGIDLVITDLKMPGMDGIELSKAIKKMHAGLPVILLNNTGDESLRQHPELFTAYINKPVKQHLLRKYVYRGLRQKESNPLNKKQKLTASFAKKYPLNILVAEDDLMNQQMLKMVLSRLGYEVNICSNGKEVLEEVSHHKYDCILMDVQMPEMDGLEATRMIRLCLSEQPAIIAMTANTLQGDREICLAAGMDDYIGKPVKLDELVDLLEKWSTQAKKVQLIK